MSKTEQPELKTAHATIASLTEVTDDPIDAMRLAADLYSMSAYRAERALAVRSGHTGPRAPKPSSKYMRAFTTSLRAKMAAVIGMFGAFELDRLRKLGPVLVHRLEHDDSDLADDVFGLMCMSPDDAVVWIREHIDEIEARFAS